MKQLHLRLDTTLYTPAQLEAISGMFGKYFSSVSFLDIEEQKKVIEKLITDNPDKVVVSMDKYIPTENNLDASRVYDIHSNYLYHNIKFNGKTARNKDVILYDHDAVGGLVMKLAQALLEVSGNTVTPFVLIRLDKEQAKTQEILDLDDFFTSGLVCEVEGKLSRFNYHTTPEILSKRASIPEERFEEFCKDFEILKQFLIS